MTIKKNNLGKTDLIKDYPVFIPPWRDKTSVIIRPTRVIRVPALRIKGCGYTVGLWLEKQAKEVK